MQRIELADSTLIFEPDFLSIETASRYFHELRDASPWVQKTGAFHRLQPRLTASYGDPGITYSYSGTVNTAEPWTATLLEIKSLIESVCGRYNYCLLNRYRTGEDSVGLHADDEPGLADAIASLSLGAARTFRLRHNLTKESRSFELGHGALLIMLGSTQRFWKHEVPKTTIDVGERINLTFRHLEMEAAPGNTRGRSRSVGTCQSERFAR